MNTNSVLVPLDGSGIAEVALPYAEALAHATGGALRLFRVVPARHQPAGGEQVEDSGSAYGLQAAQEYLEALRARTLERGFDAEAATAYGDPITEIVAAAGSERVAAVVMSTQGQSGLKRWYLGGVADAVLRMTAKTVLLVPPEHGAAAGQPLRFARIVVPLDGSELAEEALPVAAGLARASSGHLIVLNVQPASAATTGDALQAEAPAEDSPSVIARAFLDAAQARVEATLPVTPVILRGTPSEAIAAYLSEHPAEVMVMTSHGRGSRKHLVMGSTAYRLLHAGTPILLLR
jgi:nucleotide-binding universal stress UspA family protein